MYRIPKQLMEDGVFYSIELNLSEDPDVIRGDDGEYYTSEEEIFVKYINHIENAFKTNFHMLEDYNIWKRDEEEM